MEIFPSEHQQLDLDRYEKVFVRYANNDKLFGFLLLKINPAVLEGEYVHVVITSKGVILCKFLPLSNPEIFSTFIDLYRTGVFANTVRTVGQKLLSNKALVDKHQKLALRFSYICIFPSLNKSDIGIDALPKEMQDFVDHKCMFSETFSTLRDSFSNTINSFLKYPDVDCSETCIKLSDTNVNSVLQKIAPEYVTLRFATINENNSTPGASEELLVVSEDDTAVRAFRLDPEQINIINMMSKGDQLILACAGSGKSVLLIAKCFKVARMNPERKFLITCYNRNLQSLYMWYIERAGFQERNVDCLTFDGLCMKLLKDNNLYLHNGRDAIESRRNAAISGLSSGKIRNRYYGIFIDEIQMFESSWYKLCYNLIENKNNDDHIFIISGDKTQEIKKRQHRGKAPWNAGKGFPVYRGGNKSVRIEKNFRNCIEINDYINRFAQNARALIKKFIPDEEFDPDVFLRGQAHRHGNNVVIKQCVGNAIVEAESIINSIKIIHDEKKIPYDEIGITMFNRQYRPMRYFLESALTRALSKAQIPYNQLYRNDQSWGGHYGDGGVSLITFESALGLDFQAVIVCGIKPMGSYDKTKQLKQVEDLNDEMAEQLKINIRFLYVACTRAKDHLHIILTESNSQSIYNKLLTDSK